MMRPVNFGIDLGTTNSLIAKNENGTVRIYKNPVGQKETLASVVAYRKDRILVGDKAREYLVKDPVNVFGGFKRKMGTDEKYYVVNIDENVLPVELSALVLKELKTFLQGEEIPEACVITVPAAFDSMQSNATLKAGELAGFKHVFLLQEPVAAALAFFNSPVNAGTVQEGNWLVYDFGGGTFDVALIKATAEELKVADHEGNNFLGGLDLDFALIDQLIIPAIIEATGIDGFEEEFRKKYGKYEMLYYQVLYYTEEAKKELSALGSTEIEFSATLEGKEYDFRIPVSKEKAEEIFRPVINDTILLIKKIMDNNGLTADDIKEMILVGGSTYLPQVREQIEAETGIKVNASIDPTTAIAAGAAYYAANKFYQPEEKDTQAANPVADELLGSIEFGGNADLTMNLSYSHSSRDKEEVLLIACEGDYDKKYYRIIRNDGGFDTGFIQLKAKKTEFLPLITGHTNAFSLSVYDDQQNEIKSLRKEFSIAQGVYNIDGQPLPHDISLEVDDPENKTTKLEVVFERNSLLPQKRTMYREITKTIKKGSADSIIINILEGDKDARAASNLAIGCIEISGKDLQSDLIKGSDIEIQIHITESRVLHTAVFLVMTQQEFKNVFSVSEKQVHVQRLKDRFIQLEEELSENIREFQYNNNNVWEIQTEAFMDELQEIKPRLFRLKDNDKSDEKYVIAEKLSRIAKDADKLGGNERISMLLEQYFSYKDTVKESLDNVNFRKDELTERFRKMEQAEPGFIKSKNASVLENRRERLHSLHWMILSNTVSFLITTFIEYKGYEPSAFKDYNTAKTVMKMADTALAEERYSEFRQHIFTLSGLLRKVDFKMSEEFKGTGIG